ncbi:MaoC/PaaZ C-terminal domain-containing protein [Rhodococcus antarcticus]|jgi:acyl dehydratase|uniref:MaoC/PaaZ C-terminal domain-containing protein n=1 Tax=Rhodococcus antarcticus TaxID=2987751 RepID=A0ABY6P5W6_9NOCA|nr:MaoC/PaaZ C-terminal domain-containing protein [Rhodococcus antarcticus]UZJ26751.1 MaoC/PaaZ C-terminal domain-containing protein [Rhodococcus antarcticus]
MAPHTLTSPPGLAASYLRAALGALPRPGHRPSTLTDRELRLEGVRVDRGHLAEYTRVCGFGLRDTLPGTYPHVLGFPLQMHLMSAGDFPFPLLGLVHVANRIHVHRPVRAEEALGVTVRAAELRPHERGRQVDLVTEVDVAGERVWESTSTYLHRSGPAGGGSGGEPDAPTAGARWRLDGGLGRRYAAVSGDRNPIHLHPWTARALGFPRAIAHGMWTAARCLADLEGRLPAGYVQEVGFRRPVLLPGTVAFTASEVDGRWSLDLRDARTGTPHLTGTVTPS